MTACLIRNTAMTGQNFKCCTHRSLLFHMKLLKYVVTQNSVTHFTTPGSVHKSLCIPQRMNGFFMQRKVVA
jgi:hypothetical protein